MLLPCDSLPKNQQNFGHCSCITHRNVEAAIAPAILRHSLHPWRSMQILHKDHGWPVVEPCSSVTVCRVAKIPPMPSLFSNKMILIIVHSPSNHLMRFIPPINIGYFAGTLLARQLFVGQEIMFQTVNIRLRAV